MLIDQAIFCSTNSNRYQGYHLVSRSDGIDEQVARILCNWSPSHDGLASGARDASSINCFRIDERRMGISRSVYGGPEFSGRGGLQVATMLIVVEEDQLAGYDYNMIRFLRPMLAMGHLFLPACTLENLPRLEVPETPFANHPFAMVHPHLRKVVQALRDDKRLAIAGIDEPLVLMQQLIELFEGKDRLDLSFCTGLKPVSQRNFQFHFFPEACDQPLRNQLSRDKIAYISFASLGQPLQVS